MRRSASWLAAVLAANCILVSACFAAAQQPDIVYLNRCTGGCTVMSGSDNAAAGTSTIVQSPHTAPEFPDADTIFDQTAACVRHVLLPFNIHVVANSPGSAPRREVMLTTTSASLGLPSGLQAIVPFFGHAQDNVIAFVFASSSSFDATDVDGLCHTTAQTIAFLYGLEYVVSNCADVEDCSGGCGEKSFTNRDSDCDGGLSGTPGHCAAGNQTQNSYATIIDVASASDFLLANSFEAFEGPGAGPAP